MALESMNNVNDFPDFMKDVADRVPGNQQNTDAVEGYVFKGLGANQIAFWTCSENLESKWHAHAFDEWFVVIAGEYVLLLEGSEQVLRPGDETVVPSGVRQAARVSAGTRTIHAFGGQRVTES
jgi:quercetin dioxygenase-like cupin family protein